MVGSADLDTGEATTAAVAHLAAPSASLSTTTAAISLTASAVCRAATGLFIQSWDALLVGGWLVSGLVIVLPDGVSDTVPVGCC